MAQGAIRTSRYERQLGTVSATTVWMFLSCPDGRLMVPSHRNSRTRSGTAVLKYTVRRYSVHISILGCHHRLPAESHLGEMRASGVCTVLVYRASIATAIDRWGRTPRPIGKPPSKLHRTSTAVGLCVVAVAGVGDFNGVAARDIQELDRNSVVCSLSPPSLRDIPLLRFPLASMVKVVLTSLYL